MEDPIPYNPPSTNPNSHHHNTFENLSISPMDDHDFLAGDLSFPENFSGEDFPIGVDFDFTFDDLNFADDLLLEPESDVSHDLCDNIARVYDCSSEESNVNEKLNCSSPEMGSCKSNSGVEHDSGNNSDRVDHDSGNNSDRDVSSTSFDRNKSNYSGDCDRKVTVEEIIGSKIVSKRKNEKELDDDDDRISKFSKSSMAITENTSFNLGNDDDNDDEKRKARLMRNRESAQLSRQRKKQYVEELEEKVRAMHSTITELNGKISYIMAENATLRQQLSSGPSHPPPGMYPMGMAPMPYPWIPCPPYMVKPQGSQVPLVPIPRLKPQNPTPGSKVGKKGESKKNEGKTKKVASISFLGLLFFFLLFGGLVPMVNVRYGSVKQKGTVLMVDNDTNRMMGIMDGNVSHGRGRVLEQSNTSEHRPLIASLYVPRNDKLVKIDGNLIIHSVLASERAKASHLDSKVKTSEETSLAIALSYPPYPIPGPRSGNSRNPHIDENSNGRQRALGSGFSDESKSAGPDGQLQQWFREGLAGPMLSSGMCTEVFQFDVSPTPGSIVPATPMSNTTSKHRHNSTRSNKPRNRRILQEHPIPLNGRTVNLTEEHSQSDELHGNKSRSSMVVSVLVDPRETGDGDGEGVIRSKTLSRIFVVVLIDSVKYVTYSCMLPFVGSGNHLVTN